MAHTLPAKLDQFLATRNEGSEPGTLRLRCGEWVKGLSLAPSDRTLLLAEVMRRYANHCGWNPVGAKLWELMEYLIRGPKLVFDRTTLCECLAMLPMFAESCFPSQTLAVQAAKNIARLGFWPELTPILEDVYEMRRRSSRSQGAGRIAGLLLWNDPNKTMPAGQCATSIIRSNLATLPDAWRGLFLNLAPWNKDPSAAWLRGAKAHLAKVGTDVYVARLGCWSGDLRRRSPITVSAPGAEVLKALLWHLDLLPPATCAEIINNFHQIEFGRSSMRIAEKVADATRRAAQRQLVLSD